LPGQPDPIDLLRRPRLLIGGALAGIVVVSWLYLADIARDMAAMDPAMTMPPIGARDLALLLAMWWVMMIGMMLPSAAPMILTFASINLRRRARGQPYVPTALFTAGYLVAWGGFSIAATLAQWGLDRLALLAPMAMKTTSPLVAGGLLVAAGLYQLTPLKQVCLSHCRSPFDFLINRWRDGAGGAFGMGWSHGLYCLGCCWILMTLLFVVGAMDLLWVAAFAALVLVEKLVPAGPWIARATGLVLVALGGAMLVINYLS
jgi:predicted metal-binding membrane protein